MASSKKQKKRTGSRPSSAQSARAQKPAPQPRGGRNAMGLLIFCAGLILLISLFTSATTPFFSTIQRAIQGTMGKLSVCFPLVICWGGLLIAFSSRNRVSASTLALITGIVLWVVSLMQVAQYTRVVSMLQAIGLPVTWSGFIERSFIASAETTFGGGALGAVLAYALSRTIATWGASILLSFLLLTNILMLFRVPIPQLGQRVWQWTAVRSRELFGAARQSFIDWKEERDYLREQDDDYYEEENSQAADGTIGSALPAQNSSHAPRAPFVPKAPKPIPVAVEISPDGGRSNVLYIEDIVQSSDTQKQPRKRGRGEVPAYLAEQRKTYDALDVIPENVADEPAVEIIEAETIPWEPLTVVQPGAVSAPAGPVDLDVPTFARPRQGNQSVPLRAARATVSDADASPPWSDDRMEERAQQSAGDSFGTFAPGQSIANEEDYRYPPFELLKRASQESRLDTSDIDRRSTRKLEETLQSFRVAAKVVQVTHGPAITRYELQPGPGVKVSSIVSLTDDIALNMAAKGVRIEAPIPGKSAIGIEIPNETVLTVPLRDVLESDEAQHHPSKLAVALGKDIAGRRIVANLVSMPHLLIAGATGSGKSVCINTIITSIIYRAAPSEVRMILVDPKVVELSVYNGIPHLEAPVVTNPKEAAKALKWAVIEMEERYRKFAAREVRDIRGYNAKRGADEPLMPQIVVVIDELADLMLVASNDVEESICRLAQLARAAGIHLIIATQRPSVNVITGVIKSNIPSRIAFAVASQVDARTILDNSGAEKLIGRGDMLFAPQGGGKPVRVQGCFISDEEVARVVDYVKQRHEPEYKEEVIEYMRQDSDDAPSDYDDNEADMDELFRQAVEMSLESGQASISMFQRRLRIGYARAGRLMDAMARKGIVEHEGGTKPRPVLISADEFRKMMPG